MSGHSWPPRIAEDYIDDVRAAVGQALLTKLQQIRLLVFDVDGVLTPGNIVYGPEGELLKEFHTHDGFGLVLARTAGLKLAILTGRESPIAARRAEDLKFDVIKLGRFDKAAALREILDELSIEASEALYMGDDLIDIPALDMSGVSVSVPAACADVRNRCLHVTAAEGGRGAVREIVELVLKSRGSFGRALLELTDGNQKS